MIKNNVMNKVLDELLMFTTLLSAVGHDLDHTGRTNAFESATLSKLSIRYNDESVNYLTYFLKII